MILLDSDVISSLMRIDRAEPVHRWIALQSPLALYTTVITVFEVRYGIALLPHGHRRDRLESAWDEIISTVFPGRVLAFEASAANHTAELSALRKQRGLNIELADTMIAGIALANGASIATGNVKDFRDLGARVVNPWDAANA